MKFFPLTLPGGQTILYSGYFNRYRSSSSGWGGFRQIRLSSPATINGISYNVGDVLKAAINGIVEAVTDFFDELSEFILDFFTGLFGQLFGNRYY